MKTKTTLLLACFLMVVCSYSQSWQWGKRGGSVDQLDYLGSNRQEEVYGIVTDSHNNIYTLSYVGKNNLNIEGNPKTNFGDDTTLTDVCLSSFSCDGSYRWSKIFGGGGRDYIRSIQIDTQDNIYVVGWFGTCEGNTAYPPRIDNDFIISQSPMHDCNLNFIAKLSSSGNLLWIKRPQDSTDSEQSGLVGMSTDSAGTSYVLAMLKPGSYANGAFTATTTGAYPLYILKYDSNGNFISGMPLDMQLTGGASQVQFSRNPYNGYYYFAGRKDEATDIAVIGGQTVTHAGFIWCFNEQGQFQWLKESSGSLTGTMFWYNFAFDPQNNVYIAGKILGSGGENFLGMSPTQLNSPPFVMKINTDGNMLWYTYPNKDSSQYGAITLKGNEIGIATSGYGIPYIWGTQTLNITAPNQGVDAVFARFNKDTGACLGLSRIVGDNGYDDRGCALAVDSSGDYILGGGFGHQLTFANNTLYNMGPQSDFFIAKYSTSVCSLSTKDFQEQGIELAPNPVENTVKIETQENLKYNLYDITGKPIKHGEITQQENTIDFNQLTTGTYILETTNQEGKTKKVKLLKK